MVAMAATLLPNNLPINPYVKASPIPSLIDLLNSSVPSPGLSGGFFLSKVALTAPEINSPIFGATSAKKPPLTTIAPKPATDIPPNAPPTSAANPDPIAVIEDPVLLKEALELSLLCVSV